MAAINALATATKGFEDMQQLVDDFGMTTNGKPNPRRGRMGMMFGDMDETMEENYM